MCLRGQKGRSQRTSSQGECMQGPLASICSQMKCTPRVPDMKGAFLLLRTSSRQARHSEETTTLSVELCIVPIKTVSKGRRCALVRSSQRKLHGSLVPNMAGHISLNALFRVQHPLRHGHFNLKTPSILNGNTWLARSVLET